MSPSPRPASPYILSSWGAAPRIRPAMVSKQIHERYLQGLRHRSSTHRKQTPSLLRNNPILVDAPPAREGWSPTVWQISRHPLCQDIRVPTLTENTFGIWKAHCSSALSNSNQPVMAPGGLELPLPILFPATRRIKAFASPLLAYSSVFLLLNLEQCSCSAEFASEAAGASLWIATVLEIAGPRSAGGTASSSVQP